MSGLSNSGKIHDANGKKSRKWEKRTHLTKDVTECWAHEDDVDCPDTATQDAVIKHESKMKCDLKDEAKDERKEMCNPKKEAKKDLLLSKSE